MSGDLVPAGNALERLDQARSALATMESVDEVLEVRDIAVAASAYAKARRDHEAAFYAAEVKIWAERRAGEVMIDHNHRPADIARQVGLAATTVGKWRALAKVPAQTLTEFIEKYRSNGRELSASALHSAVIYAPGTRLAAGVYRLENGQLQIRWKQNGIRHRKMIGGGVREAREQLARVKQRQPEDVMKGGTSDLAYAYSTARQCLTRLDNALPLLTGDARSAVNRAMAALHKAEDDLVVALHANEGESSAYLRRILRPTKERV